MAPVRFAVFRLVTRRLGRLRQFWLLTQAFDSGLFLLTLLTAPSVTRALGSLSNTLLSWPNVSMSRHRLGGRQFDCRGIELGHVHSNGIVDLRLTASEQGEVLANGLAQRHHIAPSSTWVTFLIEKRYHAQTAASLFAIPFNRVTTQQRTSSESPSEEYAP